MKLQDAFVIRPKDSETDEVIITIGNHLATEQVFKSREEAQAEIDKTNWDLVAAMIYALKEADKWEEEQNKKQRSKNKTNAIKKESTNKKG